jgi:hypothetical protein
MSVEGVQKGRVRIRVLSVVIRPLNWRSNWKEACRILFFSRFQNGYNKEPADLFLFDLTTKRLTQLVSNGVANPGSVWKRTAAITSVACELDSDFVPAIAGIVR